MWSVLLQGLSPHGLLLLAVEPGLLYLPALGSKRAKMEAAKSVLSWAPNWHSLTSVAVCRWSSHRAKQGSRAGEIDSASWREELPACADMSGIAGGQLCMLEIRQLHYRSDGACVCLDLL